ncbi:T9SS type A sorting domain-containing protein [Litoribaculum gwangyangense]
MKSKITFLLCLIAVMLSMMVDAQTYVYNESTSSGMFFESPNGGEVSNPLSDAVNSSANCAFSGTDNPFPWLEIQYFPNYTPVSGDKLFLSVYNPNSSPGAQVQFNDGAYFGGNISYSGSGWQEYVIALDDEIGNSITKITLYPTEGTSIGVYVDNIYFGQNSVLAPAENPIVYDETESSGMFFESPNGAEVSNPLSDAVNSSANCAFSGTTNPFPWLEIQYFPTYTPVAGDKLFFSVYNPNSSPGAQVQFNDGAYFGGNITYSGTGWQEYSITLDDEIGNTMTKITLYPTEGTSIGVYVDNIYFGQSSTLSNKSFTKFEEVVFFDKSGKINFAKDQINTSLKVFDMLGRLILDETIQGKTSSKAVSNEGIYILQIEKDDVRGVKKIFFQ